MDFTFSGFLAGAGQFLLVVGVSFAVICLMTSYLRFQLMAQGAESGEAKPSSAVALIAGRIALRRAEGKSLNLLLLSSGAESGASAKTAQWMEKETRGLARQADQVFLCAPELVGLLLDAPPARLPAIAQRIAGRLDALSPGAAVRTGFAAFPEDAAAAQELIDRARAGLQAGRPAEAPVSQNPAAHHDGGAATNQAGHLDALTGVLKSEHVVATFQRFVALCRRDNLPACLLFADVDYLKRYNEQYGRDTGDAIIRTTSAFLQRHTREEDLIGRIGVDEFAIAMSASASGALGAARRLVAQAKKPDALAIGSGLRFTISIGVSSCPEHGTSIRELLEAAESAMTAVKRRGRNNCRLAETGAQAVSDESGDNTKDML
jgi:diguanylate cyclase (GGDEF)-like protein